MKTIQLNIGLSTPTGFPVDPDKATTEVRRITELSPGFEIKEGHCAEGTENVLVGVVDVECLATFKRKLHQTAIYLEQDCIAIAYDAEHGELIGPKPYAGGFDPAFFQFAEWPAERIERHKRLAKDAIGF